MTGEIGSGGVAQSGADEDVRGEMLLRRIAGETHAGSTGKLWFSLEPFTSRQCRLSAAPSSPAICCPLRRW